MTVETIGVQSFCFRGFKTIPDLIEKIRAMGVRQTELCGVHVNFADESTFPGVIEAFRNAEIGISSVGVITLDKDGKAPGKPFEFAQAAGARFASIHLPPDIAPEGLKSAEARATELGLRLAIHNHGGKHWHGSAQMLRHLLDKTGEGIGLCLDTAWALDAGEDPVAMAKEFAGRLYGIHIKDFVFDRARKGEDVVIGTGNLDLPGLFQQLEEGDFAGYAVIEYEGDVNNPVPALRSCVDQINGVLSAR